MFSRNEKYGHALHLQYGHGHNVTCQTMPAKTGILAKLKMALSDLTVSNEIENLNDVIELDLDRTTIEQAIQSELRNHESAANENQLELFEGKTA